MRAADALVALWRGAPLLQDRPPIAKSTAVLVTAPHGGDIATELNAAIRVAEADGYELYTTVAVGAGSLLATFRQPPLAWRRAQPGEPAYELAAVAATEGAGYLSYLVTAYLPKEEPTMPPDIDDPNYVPDEIGPNADVQKLQEQRDGEAIDDDGGDAFAQDSAVSTREVYDVDIDAD